jgi:hypothetical protein
MDSAELTTAAATLGLTRATGYPLYILTGHLWSYLPVGDVGYRLNLFSAFNGAITIALTERILRKMQVNRWAIFGALGLLAFSLYFWTLSLVAEVYTLQTALMAGIILLLVRWTEKPTPYRLSAAAFLFGLSLGNHAATVLLMPGCIWYLLTTDLRRVISRDALVLSVLGLFAGVSVYIYIPVRFAAEPAFNYAGHYDAKGIFHPLNLLTLKGFWALISGERFAGWMFAYQGSDVLDEIIGFWAHIWRTFMGIGIGAGMLGATILVRRDLRLGGMMLWMFFCHGIFFVNYRVPDKELMYLPTDLIWVCWVAVGYGWMISCLSSLRRNDDNNWQYLWATRTVYIILIGFFVLAFVIDWPKVNLSGDWSARERGEVVLQKLENNAVVIGYWDIVPVLDYLRLVEGNRPDITTINRFLITNEDLEKLIEVEVTHRPVYIDFLPKNLDPKISAHPVGEMYKLVFDE